MGKQNVVYPYAGKLLYNEKEWSAGIYRTMDEPQKHRAEWTKPVTKDRRLGLPWWSSG